MISRQKLSAAKRGKLPENWRSAENVKVREDLARALFMADPDRDTISVIQEIRDRHKVGIGQPRAAAIKVEVQQHLAGLARGQVAADRAAPFATGSGVHDVPRDVSAPPVPPSTPPAPIALTDDIAQRAVRYRTAALELKAARDRRARFAHELAEAERALEIAEANAQAALHELEAP